MKTEQIYRIIKRLVNGLIPSEYRNKILRWLISDDESFSKEKDEALFQFWNETEGSGISVEETQKSLLSVKEKLGISSEYNKKIYHLNSILKYAAIFILPLLSAVTVWLLMNELNSSKLNMIECFVPNGEQKEVILSDGTCVKLNSGTLFVYPEKFNGEERRVFLSGEAYFDVERDEDNPFVVRTGRLNVKVLGTSFNVNAYSDNSDITTTLNEGKVKVYRAGEDDESGIVMKPDEMLVYNSVNNDFKLMEIDADDYSSWTGGQIRFIKQPLSEILKTLKRRYNTDFRYDENIDLKELYTISFRSNETLEQVMHVVSKLIGEDTFYFIDGRTVYLDIIKKGGKRK